MARGNPNWGKGKSGNPSGRPAKPEIQLFRDAIAQVEKEQGISLLVHAIRQAYQDNLVLKEVLKKIVPDKIVNELDEGTKLVIVRALQGASGNGSV